MVSNPNLDNLRLAFVVPFMKVGGVETILLRLGRYFMRMGHTVTIVATRYEGEWWNTIHEYGLRAKCLPIRNSFSSLSHAYRIGKYLSQGLYDVILLNHAEYAQAALDMIPQNIPLIPVVHNDRPDVYHVARANSQAWNVAIGVSPKVCQRMKEIVPDRPLVFIPNGVELPSDEMWKNRAIYSKSLKLLFVGRMDHAHKGVLWLPEILAQCRAQQLPVTLSIVGDGCDRKLVCDRISALRLDDLVEFKGNLPSQQVYDEMINHHVLLMPSQFEGLPIVSMETQACGCVPIASHLPGITDYSIEHNKTGVLAPVGDVAQFVNAIRMFIEQPDLWLSMSQFGHERILRSFSVDVMGQAYLNVIQDALRGRYSSVMRQRRWFPFHRGLFGWKGIILRR